MPATMPATMTAITPRRPRNFWTDDRCAKAFWSQAELPAFQRLTADTLAAAFPEDVDPSGARVLDLGCGGGTLTRGVWQRTRGQITEILGADCAPANATRYEQIAQEFNAGSKIQFAVVNFSQGLPDWPEHRFDVIISGLSLTYAEHFDEATQRWTQSAYDHIFQEMFRVLVPGGRVAFSVNVPEPSWWTVGWYSFVTALRRTPNPRRFLKNLWRMNQYGRWLKAEARVGRFHYLPAEAVHEKLRQAGFEEIHHQLSYAKQAFVFRATRPRESSVLGKGSPAL